MTAKIIIQDEEAQPSGMSTRFRSRTVNRQSSTWYVSVHRYPNAIPLRVKTTEEFTLLFRDHHVERPIDTMSRRNRPTEK